MGFRYGNFDRISEQISTVLSVVRCCVHHWDNWGFQAPCDMDLIVKTFDSVREDLEGYARTKRSEEQRWEAQGVVAHWGGVQTLKESTIGLAKRYGTFSLSLSCFWLFRFGGFYLFIFVSNCMYSFLFVSTVKCFLFVLLSYWLAGGLSARCRYCEESLERAAHVKGVRAVSLLEAAVGWLLCDERCDWL